MTTTTRAIRSCASKLIAIAAFAVASAQAQQAGYYEGIDAHGRTFSLVIQQNPDTGALELMQYGYATDEMPCPDGDRRYSNWAVGVFKPASRQVDDEELDIQFHSHLTGSFDDSGTTFSGVLEFHMPMWVDEDVYRKKSEVCGMSRTVTANLQGDASRRMAEAPAKTGQVVSHRH